MQTQNFQQNQGTQITPFQLFQEAQIFSRLGKAKEARDRYKLLIQMIGDKADQPIIINYGIAMSKLEEEPFQNVVDTLEKGIKMNDKSQFAVIGLGNLGNYYFNRGKYQEALAVFDKAISIPNIDEAKLSSLLKNKTMCLVNLKRLDEAQKQVDQVGKQDLQPEQSTDMLIIMKYNQMITSVNQPQTCLPLCQQIISMIKDNNDPRKIEAYFCKALCSQQLNMGGIQAYEDLLQIQPDHVPALINLGNIYLLMKETEKAIELYGKALKIKPQFEIYNALAEAYQQQEPQDYKLALENFNKALELQPQNLIVLANRAWLLSELLLANEAYDDLQQISTLMENPQNLKELNQKQIDYLKSTLAEISKVIIDESQESVDKFWEQQI